MAERKPRPRAPHPAPPPALLYTFPQTARLLFDPPSAKKVRRMVAARELPSITLGGKTYIPRRELEVFLQSLPTVTAAEAITNLGQRAIIAGLRAERVLVDDGDEREPRR